MRNVPIPGGALWSPSAFQRRASIPLLLILIVLLTYSYMPFLPALVEKVDGGELVLSVGLAIAVFFVNVWVFLRSMAEEPRNSARTRRQVVSVSGALAAMFLALLILDLTLGNNFEAGVLPRFYMLFSIVLLVSLISMRAGMVTAIVMFVGISVIAGVDVAINVAVSGFIGDILLAKLVTWMRSLVTEVDEARLRIAALSVEDERVRFSRDLHDIVGQAFTAIALRADVALENPDSDRAKYLEEIRDEARGSLRKTRAIVQGYRNISLEAELENAIVLLRAQGTLIEIEGDGGEKLDENASVLAAWVVREAVTNVIRHAPNADECLIRIEGRRVEISNDGASEDESCGEPQSIGTGLLGLRERLEVAGGTLEVSQFGTTFTVACAFPVDGPYGVVDGQVDRPDLDAQTRTM